jgi:hypothetical protein
VNADLYIQDKGIGNDNPILSFAAGATGEATFAGSVNIPFSKYIGLSSSTGRIIFEDASPDYIQITDANLYVDANGIGNNASVLTFAAGATGAATFAGNIYVGTNGIGRSASVLTFGAGGTGVATFGGVIRGPGGAIGAPTYSFTGDTDTGMWQNSVGEINFSVAGAQAFKSTASVFSVLGVGGMLTTKIQNAAGTAGAPTYTFSGDSTTGMFRVGAGAVGIATGGTNYFEVDASGNVVLGAQVQLAAGATDGFAYIPEIATTPTAAPPTAVTGKVPLCYDTTNKKLWVYDGGWLGVVVA